MSRKSNISLSIRALFYPSRKDTLQQHEESQNSNVVKRDLSKQETANSSFPNLLKLHFGSPRKGLRYPRVRVRSHTFDDGCSAKLSKQPNKSSITSLAPPLLKAKASTNQANSNQYNLFYLRRVFSRCSSPGGARTTLWSLLAEQSSCLAPKGLSTGACSAKLSKRLDPRCRESTILGSRQRNCQTLALANAILASLVRRTSARSSCLAPKGLSAGACSAKLSMRLDQRCSSPSVATFRIAKASTPSVARLAYRAPEQHFELDPKGATERSSSSAGASFSVAKTNRPSETRFRPEGLQHLLLLRNARDISVHWLERLGFTFSPFAFIFGTTFFFAALASTLQKQDGKQWLEILSHTKLPGLTENKVSQMSSWIFLESVLSQYINRDNSLLVSTRPQMGQPELAGTTLRLPERSSGFSGNSLSQDAPYSAKLPKAMPRTFTFVHAKPAIGAVQLGAALQIQLSPIWSQHIKKDFLGVFPSPYGATAGLRPARASLEFAPLRGGNSTRNVAMPRRGITVREATAGRKPAVAKTYTDQSSVRTSELQKTLIWPWYQIRAYHSPNRLILTTWTDDTITEAKVSLRDNTLVLTPETTPWLPSEGLPQHGLNFSPAKVIVAPTHPEGPSPFESTAGLRPARAPLGQNNFDTSVECLRLEDDSIPSKKDSIYTKKRIHQDTLSARVLNVVKKSFYDYGLSIPGSPHPPILVPSGLTRPKDECAGLLLSKAEHGFATQSSRSQEELDKLVAGTKFRLVACSASLSKRLQSTNENLSLFGKDSVNRQFLAPSLLSRRLLSEAEQAPVLELCSVSRPSGALAGQRPAVAPEGLESKRNRNLVPAFVRSLNKNELLGKPTQSSCQAKSNLDGVLNVADQPEALREIGNLSKAGRRRGPVPGSFGSTRLLSFAEQALVQSKIEHAQPTATAGLRPARASLEFVQVLSEAEQELRALVLRTSEARRDQKIFLRNTFDNSTKLPLLTSTKSGACSARLSKALLFRNIAKPKKSFWEYAHSISGYNFPELQDYEVADLFGKVGGSAQSKVGVVTLFNEASRQRYKFGKADKKALTPSVNSWSCVDTNQVLLTPYLAKAPPKVLLTASNKTEGLTPHETAPCSRSKHKADLGFALGFLSGLTRPKDECANHVSEQLSNPTTYGRSRSKLCYAKPRRSQPAAVTLASLEFAASTEKAKLGLPETFIEVESNAKDSLVLRTSARSSVCPVGARIEVGKAERQHEQLLTEDFTIRYTPLELEQENKVKKAFKELGRDYSDYLKQPKDSLPALLLSPSLEEDKQIEEEEIQRLAQEKAAAKAAAKRTQNEEEYSLSDSAANEEEFNSIDLDPSGQLLALLSEAEQGQQELRSAIEVALREGKNSTSNLEEEPLNDEEIEDSRFERLRFTREVETKKEEEDCRGLALSLTCRDSNAPVAGLGGARQPRLDQINDKLTVGQLERSSSSCKCSASLSKSYAHSSFGRVRSEGTKKSYSGTPLEPNQSPRVSNRKHSFFGQRSFWPTRLFSQEERLVSAHIVNPYILYDQSNPWLIPEQGTGLPVTSQTKPSANSPTSCSTLVSTGPANRDEGRLLSLRSKVCKTDDLQNLKNLQTQARLDLIRFVHLPLGPFGTKRSSSGTPLVEVPLVDVPATAGLRPVRASRTVMPLRGIATFRAEFAPLRGAPGTYIYKAGNQNRIYKPDPRLRLTPLESSISADWRNDRKVEASPFRDTSKKRPHIVLPQLSENEWQKSIEWQVKRHFLDEDTRLQPLVATEPYKTFKVKRIDRCLPWLTLEKPSFKLLQWPYKPVGMFALLNPSVPGSAFSIDLAGTTFRQLERSSSSLPKGAKRAELQLRSSCPKATTHAQPDLTRAKGLPVTFSKDRSALSVGSNPLFDVTKKLFSNQGVLAPPRLEQHFGFAYGLLSEAEQPLGVAKRQHFGFAYSEPLGNVNAELLFEPPSTSSWFLIYRLFLALILKEVFKYIYRISLKDFFIRIINSDFGRTITSAEFRQSIQFEPFPEFYKPKNRLKDLIGIKNALLPLSEIIWFLRNNCRSRNGPHGVILLGPEGVDTTAIAQAVAGEAKVPIIVQSLRALTLTHSHPQKRLEKVLLLARAQSPCVLFLDELDVIGQSREGVIRNTSGDGNSLISLNSSQFADRQPQPQSLDDQATSQGRRVDLMLRLLTVMDGLHHLNGVVIITTSKNTATLDPALLRPGRFDRLIHLTLPNHEDRMELFKVKTSGLTRPKDECAKLLQGPGGAQHSLVLRTSARMLSEAEQSPRLGHTDQMPLVERSSLLSVAELEYLCHRTANMGGADIVSAINYSTLRAIVNDTVHTVETLEYGLNCVKALKEKQGVLAP